MRSTEVSLGDMRTVEREEEAESEDKGEVEEKLLSLFSDEPYKEEPAAFSRSCSYSSTNVNINLTFLPFFIMLLNVSF